MDTNGVPTRKARERKLLLLMPVFGVALMTPLFWLFGGGRDEQAGATLVVQGLNMKVPEAHVVERPGWSKENYYEQAERDSLLAGQREKEQEAAAGRAGIGADSIVAGSTVLHDGANARYDPRLGQVEEKMAEVRRRLQASTHPEGLRRVPPPEGLRGGQSSENGGSNIERLERIMGLIRKKDTESDPEMKDIRETIDRLSRLTTGSVGSSDSADVKNARDRKRMTQEYAADSVEAKDGQEMEALAPDEQVLMTGERLRLELARDVLVGRVLIPRGTPVYGNASLSGERLMVTIRSIYWEGHVYPVSLNVYDQDGLAGIYIPGVPGTDALRESAVQDVGGLGTEVFSPTLAGQAAGAGIEAARSLMAKKIRRVRVVVPADYRLILRDSHKTGGL